MACFASECVVGKLRESQRIASFLCCDASTENALPTAGFLVNLPRVVKLENIVLARNMPHYLRTIQYQLFAQVLVYTYGLTCKSRSLALAPSLRCRVCRYVVGVP